MGHPLTCTIAIAVAALSFLCGTALAETYYVTPMANSSCPNESVPCFTLSEYVNKTSNDFASNTTLILLSGNHNLELEFFIRNITVLMIIGNSSATEIACTTSGRLRLEGIEQVSVSMVYFSGCVNNSITSVDYFTIEDSVFHGQGRIGTALMMNTANGSIIRSVFMNNNDRAIFITNCSMSISESVIRDNSAGAFGGGLYADNASLTFQDVKFIANSVSGDPARNVRFDANSARGRGGAVYAINSEIELRSCDFTENNVEHRGIGGAVCTSMSNVTIFNSTFSENSAVQFGGAIFGLGMSVFELTCCKFFNNTSGYNGGAVYTRNSQCSVDNSEFVHNTVSASTGFGGAIYLLSSLLSATGYLRVHNDKSPNGAVFMHTSTANFAGNVSLLNNDGGFYIFASNVVLGTTNIMNSSSSTRNIGRALTCFQSNVTFAGITTNLEQNTGLVYGGAIFAQDCSLDFCSDTVISQNYASLFGGGIYVYQSEINIKGRVIFSGNKAGESGGGIFAAASNVNLKKRQLVLVNNHASRGGGVYLEQATQLLLIKNSVEYSYPNGSSNRDDWLRLEFTGNTADYGGALYINDSNSGACQSNTLESPISISDLVTECFLQTVRLYDTFRLNLLDRISIDQLGRRDRLVNLQNSYFSNNSAAVAGGNIYGGLLDRCKLSFFSEEYLLFQKFPLRDIHFQRFIPGFNVTISFLTNINNIELDTISSDPVRVYFCQNGQPNRTYTPSIQVLKGQTFRIPVVAVDQANNPVEAVILSSVDTGKLGIGQVYQSVNASCNDLVYKVFSSISTVDRISLYAEGPCDDIGVSGSSFQVFFNPCPIGFEETQSECMCDSCLLANMLITNCSIDDQTVLRKENVWFTVDNTSDQLTYLTYQNCPFDYCLPGIEDVHINLSFPDGADAQCAFNRSGRLCGSCKDGLSVTLGSSNCKKCSNNGIALLIAFAVLGILLVIILLALNLTVAVGTINGLIFYANIIAANRAVFLPSSNYLTVFIAWLNLDFGIETCFFDGLDSYLNVWLQGAFPVYLIFLVILVMVLAHFSQHFAKLLSTRNPVATLATLIFLSYAKLLRTVVAALSFTKLEYLSCSPNDQSKVVSVWRVDGNIGYFKGKHIPLFLVALAIAIVGVAFTWFLIFWQCLQRCPRKRYLRWIRNVKLNAFMDAYVAPYNTKHRYWTGLLLLVRVILYVVAAVSDPSSTLLAISVTAVSLYFIKEILKEKIYKNWLLNFLENMFILNLIIFTIASFYVRETGGNQAALTYTSTIIAFVTFVIILVYHAFTSFNFLKNLVYKLKRKARKPDKVKENAGVIRTKSINAQNIMAIEHPTDASYVCELREPVLDYSFEDVSNVETEQSATKFAIVTHSEIEGIPCELDNDKDSHS